MVERQDINLGLWGRILVQIRIFALESNIITFYSGLDFKPHAQRHSVISSFPSFSLHDMMCDPTDLIWREGTPFEAMTRRTAFIDGLLTEVFRDFPQL